MVNRSSLTYLFFSVIDVSLTLVALRLARFLRESIPLGVYLEEPLQFSPWLYLIVPIIWLVVFTALRVYSPARSLRSPTDLPVVWGAIIGASLIFAGVAYLLFRELSRFLFFYFFVLDLILLSGWRRFLLRLPGLARRLYGADRRVLIVGAGPPGQALARAIAQHPITNLTLVGFADDDFSKSSAAGRGVAQQSWRLRTGESPHFHSPLSHSPELGLGPVANERAKPEACYPILGTINEVPRLVQKYQLQEIIFALPPARQPLLRSLVMALQTVPVNLRLVPDVFDLVFLRASVEEFEGIPLIGLREPAIRGLDRLIKRLFDLIISALLLIILAPMMIIIALLIKLDSPGPFFFRQRRVGEGGRLFWMIKFRTMFEGAEQIETQLLHKTADDRPIFAKIPEDPRVSRVGRFLRRTSLDELPQLFNVLKGEMSLVGPRPELPWLVERYEPWQRKRFAVPQGMTGWWQVNGRMERADPYERIEDDLFYIRNYSLWLDLRILWKTIQAVVQGEGAY